MVRGPFGSFRHEHGFAPYGETTRMTDVIRFRMGLGILGRLADPFALAYLKHLMAMRNTTIKAKAENDGG